nr:MAG: hypothetical protein EDM05_35910 [Leptolyngbya sp. IPPAS B-1204]
MQYLVKNLALEDANGVQNKTNLDSKTSKNVNDQKNQKRGVGDLPHPKSVGFISWGVQFKPGLNLVLLSFGGLAVHLLIRSIQLNCQRAQQFSVWRFN